MAGIEVQDKTNSIDRSNIYKAMRSLPTLVGFLSLALFADFSNGRKDSGEYWQGGVQRERGDCDPSLVKGDVSFFEPKPIGKGFTIKRQRETSEEPNGEISFVRDFGPEPIARADLKSNGEISFVRDFGPKPIARAFTTDLKSNGDISFKPKHMTSNDDQISFVRDFGPRPIAKAFTTDLKSNGDISFVRDFGPKPIARAFTTDLNHKHMTSTDDQISFVRDFGPHPIAKAFTTDNKHKISFLRDFEPKPIAKAFVDHKYMTSNLNPQVEKSYTDDESQLKPNVSPI